MRKLILILFITLSTISFGQTDLEKLKEEGNSIENIIPVNWKILDSKFGDLNQDGIPDYPYLPV